MTEVSSSRPTVTASADKAEVHCYAYRSKLDLAVLCCAFRPDISITDAHPTDQQISIKFS